MNPLQSPSQFETCASFTLGPQIKENLEIDDGIYAPFFMQEKIEMCRFLRCVLHRAPFEFVSIGIQRIEIVEEVFKNWSPEKARWSMLLKMKSDDSLDIPELIKD